MKQGWEIKRLGDVCDIIMGQSPSSYTYNDSIGLPFFQGNADFGKISPIVRVFCSAPIKIAYKNDILISVRAPIGAINIADRECCIGRGLAAIRSNNILKTKYIYHVIVANKGKLIAQGTGSTFKSIGRNALKELQIPVPERAEQERIVGELDCLSGIIANKRAQLRELDTLAQSIFYTMFGDPITNDKGWQTKKLGDVALIVGGSTPSTREETNWNGDLNWVTPAELNGTLYYGETQRKITTEGARGLELLPVGTVLLSSRAPIGKLAITTVPMYCNQGFKNVVCGESINNIYVYYYLLATIENVKALGVGATFKEVSKRAVENYHILVPPIDLQKQFAEKIENIERQKELITKSIKETEDLFNSRMSYYFD